MGACNETPKRKDVTDSQASKDHDSNQNENKDISKIQKFQRSTKRKFTTSK